MFASFLHAHHHELSGDASSAIAAYESLVAASSTRPYDDAQIPTTSEPPLPLLLSVAWNSLGGLRLDAGDLHVARAAFHQSVAAWPGNSMALLNLGDLEREHGGRFDAALAWYARAAALPPRDAPADAAAWYEQLVASPRAECAALASYMCALLQMQLGDYDAARAHQRRFGCRFRVAPAVWKLVGADAAPPAAPDRSGVQRCEGAVPPALLARLRAAFAIDSPFWEQTDYSARGYFSFWEATAAPPATLIDVYVREVLLPLVANADDVVGAEWWVHTRASRRSIGHQMHFDTEEATLQLTGEVVHPTVSSVLYLSGAGGDPTVVFDQRADDDAPAAHAHVSHPVEGAVLLFPGDRLHCVCPAAPRDARKRGRDDDDAAAAPLRDARDAPQRVTLMVGLWTRDVASVCRRRPLDACGPLPRPTRSCTWPSLIALRADDDAAALGAAAAPPTRHAVPRVAAPWERIDGGGGGGAAGDATWAGRTLEPPEGRNHRFWVKSMGEFREQMECGGADDSE